MRTCAICTQTKRKSIVAYGQSRGARKIALEKAGNGTRDLRVGKRVWKEKHFRFILDAVTHFLNESGHNFEWKAPWTNRWYFNVKHYHADVLLQSYLFEHNLSGDQSSVQSTSPIKMKKCLFLFEKCLGKKLRTLFWPFGKYHFGKKIKAVTVKLLS